MARSRSRSRPNATFLDENDWTSYLFKGVIVVVMFFTFLGAPIIPFINVIMGAIHFHDCPYLPYIPIYLIVLGGLWIIWIVSFLVISRCDLDECLCFSPSFFKGVVLSTYILLLGVHISGAVTVTHFRKADYNTTSGPSYSPDSSNYCSPTLYDFAFDVTWILMVLDITFPICFCFYFHGKVENSSIDRHNINQALSI